MVTWRYVRKEVRDRYERRFGIKPPGYRGTGAVEWFNQWHEKEAPCKGCEQLTDRWRIDALELGDVEWGEAHVDDQMPKLPVVGEAVSRQKKRAFVATVAYAFCWPCERRAAIAVLKVRQQNLEIYESVRAGEARLLAEYEAEERGEVVAA